MSESEATISDILGNHVCHQFRSPRELMVAVRNWSESLPGSADIKWPRAYRLFDPVGWKTIAVNDDGESMFVMEQSNSGWLVTLWAIGSFDNASLEPRSIENTLKDYEDYSSFFPAIKGDEGRWIRTHDDADDQILPAGQPSDNDSARESEKLEKTKVPEIKSIDD